LKLKQTTAAFLSFLLFLFLVIPEGSFALAQPDAGQPVSKKLQTEASFPTVIKVVSASGAVGILPVWSGNPSCMGAPSAPQNLVQDTGILNLNQPASCFSISLAEPVVSPSLAVEPLGLSAPGPVGVVSQPVYAPNYALPVAAQNLPLLPVAASVLMFAAVLVFTNMERKNLKPSRLFLIYNLSISQLQVFRC
jgi:hypothetical protein